MKLTPARALAVVFAAAASLAIAGYGRVALALGWTPPGGPTVGTGQQRALAPNKMGRIPILEYHQVGDKEAPWIRERHSFERDLELLYTRGYRPITVAQLLDKKFDIPAGTSPVVFTFDDASPSQFRYIEHDGKLEIDSTSAVGIWLAFHRKHSDWGNRATFCMLPAASDGHAFFGNGRYEGQKAAWRFPKLRFLADSGFELCNHTLWHANLAKYSDAFVQEQIARGALAIDSAVPGYKVRTFALPLGVWPKNRALAKAGSWKDPKTGRTVSYDYDAILEVAGGPNRSPYDPKFNPLSLLRVEAGGSELEKALDRLDRTNDRFVAGN